MLKPMKRYDHRSHVSGIPRMKRLIQLVDSHIDFEEWKAQNLEINQHGERHRRKQSCGKE